MTRSIIFSLGGAVVAVALGLSCDSSTVSECHREQVERAGCCPACDADCRATITRACAEVHDEPLLDAELEVGSSDGGVGPDDEPTPPTPQ